MRSKRILLPLISTILLAACGENDYYGVYAFQLGKDKGTHFGISLELSKERYVVDNVDKGEKFTLLLNMNKKDQTQEESSIIDLNNLSIYGTYTFSDSPTKDDSKKLDLEIIASEGTSIPSEFLDDIMYAKHKDDLVTVYIPVSVEDLGFQLYWYGIDLFNPLGPKPVAHQIGTHPTNDDIAEINKSFPTDHDNKVFRDWHTLAMGLAKK